MGNVEAHGAKRAEDGLPLPTPQSGGVRPWVLSIQGVPRERPWRVIGNSGGRRHGGPLLRLALSNRSSVPSHPRASLRRLRRLRKTQPVGYSRSSKRSTIEVVLGTYQSPCAAKPRLFCPSTSQATHALQSRQFIRGYCSVCHNSHEGGLVGPVQSGITLLVLTSYNLMPSGCICCCRALE